MPPRRQRASEAQQAPSSIALPESVWAQIASHFSLKDWAKATGICRTTFNLQLRNIAIPCSLSQAGLAWVSKRLSCAHALQLDTEDWQKLADTLRQDLNKLTGLQQLEITGDPPVDGDEALAHMLPLLWLLACSPKLTVLSTCLGELPWFPPLLHIKHLELIFAEVVEVDKVFAAIPSAANLVSLSLKAEYGILEAPELQLQSMPSLERVGLVGFLPAAIHMPEGCILHLGGLGHDDLSGKEWDAALPYVTTFFFKDFTVHIEDNLPAYFAEMHILTIVKIQVDELGSARCHVCLEGLARVKRLCLIGTALYVKVPARVSWRGFTVESQTLGVSFADAAWFAMNVSIAAFRYRVMSGSSLLEVTREWSACCRSWSSKEFPWRGHESTFVTCPPDTAMNFSHCFCGVCMSCLRDLGVAHAHVV